MINDTGTWHYALWEEKRMGHTVRSLDRSAFLEMVHMIVQEENIGTIDVIQLALTPILQLLYVLTDVHIEGDDEAYLEQGELDTKFQPDPSIVGYL